MTQLSNGDCPHRQIASIARRFKGAGEIHERGTTRYADCAQRLREAGSTLVDRVKAIVVIEVQEVRELVSPAYDDGSLTEEDLIRTFRARFAGLHGDVV